MSATKRVTHKDMKIEGRDYVVKKMDARLATYVAFQLRSLIPTGEDVSSANALAGHAQRGMSRKEFFSLQNDCLSVCFHKEKAGEISVLDDAGNIQDPDLQYNAKAILMLTIQSLGFNVMDFFDEAFLKELDTQFRSMIPSPVRT